MKLISHRGNTNGRIPEKENSPNYIVETLNKGFDVEIDIWFKDMWFLGHDGPIYEIYPNDFQKYSDRIWFHCKNIDSLYKIREFNFHYFWHQTDDYTLTSKGFIWTYPNKPLTDMSICVIPEDYKIKEFPCYGICSDFIERYLSNF